MTNSHSSKGPKTLSIGGATFDLFTKIDNSAIHDCGGKRSFALPLGGKIRIADVVGTCGGGANNTSVGLSRLGCIAAFGGVIGDDEWGDAIRRNLETEGVSLDHLTVIEHEPSSFSLILLSPDGERAILTHKSMDRHFHDVTFDREAAGTMDAIYLNHMHQDSCAIEDDLIAALKASPKMHLTWNPGGAQIEDGLRKESNCHLLAHTSLLLLNKEEALTFCGIATTKDAMQMLITAGVKIVCITDGANGAKATDGKTLYSCSAPRAKVVDATGAGDSFGTAMTWAILNGKDLPTALKAGTINAISVVGSMGAQKGLLTHTQIQTELTKQSLEVTSEPF